MTGAEPSNAAARVAARAEAGRLIAAFEARGAEVVEAAVLQPAETLLDLYGEDIRARAYVTWDPLAGEVMLRPDFTVPVVEMHLARGQGEARYAYAGEVFRMQEAESERPSEYLQAGYELFGGDDPAAADAEVFALFAGLLAAEGLTPSTGDIGLLQAAVGGLRTSAARRAALLRHLWRPRKFRELVERYSGRGAAPAGRAAVLAAADPFAGRAPEVGLRSRAEVEARLKLLAEDAAEAPVSAGEIEMLDELLNIRETSPMALAHLKHLAVDMPAIAGAVEAMARRLDAMARLGIDVEALGFEAAFGRTTLEYYDGFVFGFHDAAAPDMPPVASGGRYDALVRALGGSVGAVGGVIRPEQLAGRR